MCFCTAKLHVIYASLFATEILVKIYAKLCMTEECTLIDAYVQYTIYLKDGHK